MFLLISCGLLFPYSGSPDSPRPKRVFLQVQSHSRHTRKHKRAEKTALVLVHAAEITFSLNWMGGIHLKSNIGPYYFGFNSIFGNTWVEDKFNINSLTATQSSCSKDVLSFFSSLTLTNHLVVQLLLAWFECLSLTLHDISPHLLLHIPPPDGSTQHGPSTTCRARWRAGTRVCGSIVLTSQAYNTSPPTSLRSMTAFAPTAARTSPSVVTPGSCLWSSSASQPRFLTVFFCFMLLTACAHLSFSGVFAGRTGTFLLQKCLPALQWSSACCPKRRPAGGLSKWPSVWQVRSALCGQNSTIPHRVIVCGLRDKTLQLSCSVWLDLSHVSCAEDP